MLFTADSGRSTMSQTAGHVREQLGLSYVGLLTVLCLTSSLLISRLGNSKVPAVSAAAVLDAIVREVDSATGSIGEVGKKFGWQRKLEALGVKPGWKGNTYPFYMASGCDLYGREFPASCICIPALCCGV